MSKNSTPSFVLTLKLNTSSSDERKLEHRFYCAFLLKNRLVSHARKRLSSMRQDKRYRALMTERKALGKKTDRKSKHRRAEIGKQLSTIRMEYGLSEYQFHAWIREQQHRYRKQIDSMTTQKVASSVWRSVESVLYRKGKSIHFQKLDSMQSLEGKNNTSGIRFSGGRLHWNGLVIQPQIRKGDTYARAALTHRVKYCRIKRIAVGSSRHYYLQLVLEGIPPKKHVYIDGRVGIDQGTSSVAACSEHGCMLVELAPERKDVAAEVRRLQRKMDRSRRAANPGNYLPDGTIKSGKKRWIRSRSYKKTQFRLKSLRRRNADAVRQSEERLANTILGTLGTDIVTEEMDFRALQRRAKEDRKGKDGRHRSKKRYGKSLACHAPGRMHDTLNRKLAYIGKEIFHVDTWKFRASQYDHVTGTYTRTSLGKRSKLIGGQRVQRDLYSSFLLMCAKDQDSVDRNLCTQKFSSFLNDHNICIRQLLKTQNSLSSFGLKDFAA